MPYPKTLSCVIVANFLTVFVFAGDQCYYLDGKPAGGVYRCDNATSGESSCCNAGQICYSNGVCQAGPQNHPTDWPRVGCTDKTWSSPACLKQCTTIVPESSAGIRPCGGILSSEQYCCDAQGKGPGSVACCTNSSNIFAIDPIPSIIATILLNPTQTAKLPSSSITAGPGSKSSSSNLLVSISTVSPTLKIISASSPPTTSATSYIPSSSYNVATSNFTAISSTASSSFATSSLGSASTLGSSSTKPAAATKTSSMATRFGSLGFVVSFGIATFIGLLCAL